MDDISDRWFGLFIAYVLPGLVVLLGVTPFSPTLRGWFSAAEHVDTGLAGVIHLVMASTTVGLITGCVRWCVVDQIMELLGVTRPKWDDSKLRELLPAFDNIVQRHYRYYQFYSGVLLALPFAYGVFRMHSASAALGLTTDICFFLTEIALFAGSKDTLTKYHGRAVNLLGLMPVTKEVTMTNGEHHDSGGKSDGKKNAAAKQAPTPAAAPTVTTELKTPASHVTPTSQ
jgi:hypothetical protein